MRKRLSLFIGGRVQGVFFRHGARNRAKEIALVGWVRNESDGSVRIIAEGDEENLNRLVEWCKQGTEWSEVRRLEVKWSEATGEFTSFEVR